MEYININSIQNNPTTAPDLREKLLLKYGHTPPEYVITTDKLELLRGEDLVEGARQRGEALVPLRRASNILDTQGFPKRVILEITSVCNSDCTMCPRTALTRNREHMDTQLCKKIIKELSEEGIGGLWLMNLGEPLLHPDFFEILDYCRSVGNLGPIWISTNGRIFDAAMQGRLLEKPVDFLNYSVNAMTETSYKKIAPSLEFEANQKNIRDFIRLKKASGRDLPVIRVQMIEIPYVMGEIDGFLKEFGDKADIVSINKLEEFAQDTDPNSAMESSVRNARIDKCNRLDRQDVTIFADGSLTCCATDFNGQLTVGNLMDNSIREIMNGDRYLSFIRGYREGRLHENDLCSRCRDFYL